MTRLERVAGVAAALPLSNLDTDQILPGRFLKTVSRAGLGSALFHALRYDDAGQERQDFVLNRLPWRRAEILIALDNLGCGSSREHAPWALADFGFRVLIAQSFADIFRNNCLKNGILPIVLPYAEIEVLIRLAQDPSTARFVVDLPAQTLTAGGDIFSFEIASDRKAALLTGRDEIADTELQAAAVASFELARAYTCPTIPLGFAMGQS